MLLSSGCPSFTGGLSSEALWQNFMTLLKQYSCSNRKKQNEAKKEENTIYNTSYYWSIKNNV